MEWKRADRVKLPGMYILFDTEDMQDEFPNVAIVLISAQPGTGKLFVKARNGFVSALENYCNKSEPSDYVFLGPIQMPVVGAPE